MTSALPAHLSLFLRVTNLNPKRQWKELRCLVCHVSFYSWGDGTVWVWQPEGSMNPSYTTSASQEHECAEALMKIFDYRWVIFIYLKKDISRALLWWNLNFCWLWAQALYTKPLAKLLLLFKQELYLRSNGLRHSRIWHVMVSLYVKQWQIKNSNQNWTTSIQGGLPQISGMCINPKKITQFWPC